MQFLRSSLSLSLSLLISHKLKLNKIAIKHPFVSLKTRKAHQKKTSKAGHHQLSATQYQKFPRRIPKISKRFHWPQLFVVFGVVVASRHFLSLLSIMTVEICGHVPNTCLQKKNYLFLFKIPNNILWLLWIYFGTHAAAHNDLDYETEWDNGDISNLSWEVISCEFSMIFVFDTFGYDKLIKVFVSLSEIRRKSKKNDNGLWTIIH